MIFYIFYTKFLTSAKFFKRELKNEFKKFSDFIINYSKIISKDIDSTRIQNINGKRYWEKHQSPSIIYGNNRIYMFFRIKSFFIYI